MKFMIFNKSGSTVFIVVYRLPLPFKSSGSVRLFWIFKIFNYNWSKL